jgi:septal ring factor EnvC (AmiA/AmiB activator)
MATRNGQLETALATLIQNQAAFVSQLADEHRRLAKNEQDIAEVKSDLEQIKEILMEHGKVLAGLPEAIRQKIGFKSQ